MMRYHHLSHHIGHALILAGAGLCMTAYLLGESRAAQEHPGQMGMDQMDQIDQQDEGENPIILQRPFIPAPFVPITG
ncbi:hypothetical protein [Thalassospira alkalitolerans]|uniref:hypothetical protein n=1 Tax=Thalassospira alkalitolerans TaxID=1293890 RepID=UPI003AA99951